VEMGIASEKRQRRTAGCRARRPKEGMTADCNPSLCKSAEKRRGRTGRQSIRAEQQADIFVCSLGYRVARGGNWTRTDSALARANR